MHYNAARPHRDIAQRVPDSQHHPPRVTVAELDARQIRRKPVGAENLCHQAIFMNHASGAVAPPDAEVVQVGDAIWQRAPRRGLVQGSVRQISFKPTSRRSSHPLPSLPAAGHGMKPTRTPQGICPGGIGFRHPQGQRRHTSVNEYAQTWKACCGQPLKGSNPLSSASQSPARHCGVSACTYPYRRIMD